MTSADVIFLSVFNICRSLAAHLASSSLAIRRRMWLVEDADLRTSTALQEKQKSWIEWNSIMSSREMKFSQTQWMGVTNPVKHSELVWLGYWLVTFHWWLLSKSLRSPPGSGLLLVSSLERWQMEGSDQLKIILWYFHLILSWYVLWTTIFVLENNWKILENKFLQRKF